jgi:CubicO group peptidase (beta-lactamase class C family)
MAVRALTRIATVLALAGLVHLAQPVPAASQQNPLADLDDYVRQVMHDWEAPGIAVAVVKDGRVVVATGYGVREVGRPEEVDAATVFAIASTSKAFTAAALGMLV